MRAGIKGFEDEDFMDEAVRTGDRNSDYRGGVQQQQQLVRDEEEGR
jgi:hypothetical protein